MQGLRRRPLEFVSEMAERYGDFVFFGGGRDPVLFVNHPDLAREVLVTRSQDFVRADTVRNALRIFDGESTLVSEGDQWRQQRRLLQQGFRSERLRRYARLATTCTHDVTTRWPAKGIIDADQAASEICLKTLSQMLFGQPPSTAFADSLRMVLDARSVETGRAVASVSARFNMFRSRPRRALAHVHHVLETLIGERRRAGDRAGEDMLSLLVRVSGEDLRSGRSQQQVDRQVRDETISMINASLDAMTAALSWTLLLLAQYPSIENRVREEVQHALAEHSLDLVDVVELPTAERTVHEALRLYPPNWLLMTRRGTKDTRIGSCPVSAGSWVYIFPYVLHRDARWFSSPTKFDPDRFLPDRFGAAQKAAYMPLGLGPHVCIGKALSTILLTSMLACLLDRFRFELPPAQPMVRPQVGVVLQPQRGWKLQVRKNSDL